MKRREQRERERESEVGVASTIVAATVRSMAETARLEPVTQSLR